MSALVASAARLRWRAPELALLMADQASIAAAKADAESVRLRAEVLAVFACNQLGRGAGAGGRAVRALRAAERAGEETTERLIRVELAACAADASAPSVGLAVLLPVFGRVSSAPTARAAAMVTAADCLARLGGGSDVAALLNNADRLYDTSRSVEPDAVLLRRGVVHARLAAYHRRRGDHTSAEAAARAGLALVEELSDGELDTGQVSGSLTTELVLALLDSGRVAEAVLAAQPVLRRPARPAGAPAACWLRLALVSRVHLPAGRHSLARRLLGEAIADAERNQLDVALAECRQSQAQLHETCAELGEALHSIRAAYVADRRWRDTAAELRTLLAAEFGQPAPAAELRSALSEVVAVHGAAVYGRTPESSRPDLARPDLSRSDLSPSDRSRSDLSRPDLSRVGRQPRRATGPHRHRRPATMITGSVGADSRPGTSVDTLGDHEDDNHARLQNERPSPDPAPRPRSEPEPAAAPHLKPAPDATPAEAGTAGPAVAPGLMVAAGTGSAPEPGVAAEPAVAVGLTGTTEPAGTAEPAAAAEPAGTTRPADTTGPMGTAEPGVTAGLAGAAEPAAVAPGPGIAAPPAGGAEPAFTAGSAAAAAPTTTAGQPVGAEPGVAVGAELTAAAGAESSAESAPAAEPTPEPEQAAGGIDSTVEGQPAAVGGEANGLADLLTTNTNGYDRGSGRHRSDVAMADLLAEALLAYQNGRRSRLAAAAGGTSLEQPPPTTPPVSAPPPPVPQTPSAPQPPLAQPPPPQPPPQPQVRWIDLPPELVWREPGSDRRW